MTLEGDIAQLGVILGTLIGFFTDIRRRLGNIERRQKKHGTRLTTLRNRVVLLEGKLEE